MAELNLKVGLVGKLLVHYKLAKPDAVAPDFRERQARRGEIPEKEQGGIDSRIDCSRCRFCSHISDGQLQFCQLSDASNRRII